MSVAGRHDHWSQHARQWSLVGQPLRPGPEDIGASRTAVAEWLETAGRAPDILVMGVTPELSTTGGSSDARFIRTMCPVLELGLVGATMHQVDERAPVADIEALTGLYARLIERYFNSLAAGA